ncbi:MAG: hypothetical protein KF819_19800 [Labilithrix sp.]|nr:hypothetical protein [Labilithrix sp.]
MPGPHFDPNGAVRFDLRAGAASDSRGSRLVLIPSGALESLTSDALARIGRELGRASGARVAQRLGGADGVRAASVEVFVANVAGELAVAGVGAVHIERWGRAMIAVVTNPSVSDDAFAGAVLAGALSEASGRDVAAASLGREGNVARYFVGSPATAARAQALAEQGGKYADVVASLQQGGAS